MTYLRSKESVTDAILQTDQTLTEKEKEIEGEEQVKRLHSLNSFYKFKLFGLENLGSLNKSQRSKDSYYWPKSVSVGQVQSAATMTGKFTKRKKQGGHPHEFVFLSSWQCNV